MSDKPPRDLAEKLVVGRGVYRLVWAAIRRAAQDQQAGDNEAGEWITSVADGFLARWYGVPRMAVLHEVLWLRQGHQTRSQGSGSSEGTGPRSGDLRLSSTSLAS